jgi:HPt (histidine-containing phosphotransfer) domain-containing protein
MRRTSMDLNTILELQRAGVDTEGALRRFSGNSALYERFLKKFLEDGTFSKITKAFEEESREDALMATHTLKGVTANLGMDKLFNISSSMVDCIRADRFEDAAGAYPQLKEAYEEICGILAND